MSEGICSHAFLGRPGQLRLVLCAPSLLELATEAGRAVGLRVHRGQSSAAPAPWLDIEIRAEGEAAVLAEWIGRLLHLASMAPGVALECEIIQADERGLRARVSGVGFEAAPWSGMVVVRPACRVEPDGRGLRAEIVFEGAQPLPSRGAVCGPGAVTGRQFR